MERKDEKKLRGFCRTCGSAKFKVWEELTADEKFLVERTSAGKISAESVKHRRFCARCFYADTFDNEKTV